MFLTVTKHAIEVTCFNEKTVFQTPPPSPRLPNSFQFPTHPSPSLFFRSKQTGKTSKQTNKNKTKQKKIKIHKIKKHSILGKT